jgi:thioredoxin reductase/SAM-dependent methyltransferase
MSEHETRIVERHCDVAIVGGSAAGLAAALQFARQRRSVIVIDDGRPRNAPAAHMHSFLSRDGMPPAELTAAGRAEVRSYGGEIISATVSSVARTDDDRFRLEIPGGHSIVARRVIAATGIRDVLPDIEGIAEHWGGDVIHCPFCHGFEVRDRAIVHIVTHPMGLHPAPLFRQLTDRLTVVLHGDVPADTAELDALRAAGVDVRSSPVRRLVTADGTPRGPVTAVELADGSRIDADAVAIGPEYRARVEAFVALGLQTSPHPSGLGDFVPTDPTGATDIPGLYAAGNITDPSQQVLQAAANGSRVGGMVSFSLADEDVRAAARPSGTQVDWEQRYSGEPVWSGNPNGTLVDEAGRLEPGRALDVGAGEGGDAIWLAERGWKVTANDISQRALDRVAAAGERRGLSITCQRADANSLNAFETGGYDLVTASYASIPRTPDLRAVRTILDAVAPGGTLLVVSHDLQQMRESADSPEHVHMYDPDAYVWVEDFAAAIADSPDWEIQTHGPRPRPAGAVSTEHHVDVVLRARRKEKASEGDITR